MKKIFTLCALLVALTVSADFRTIELDDNCDVREILKTDTMTLDSLKVKGYVNFHNLYFISWMTNRKLKYIDFGESRFSNDELPDEGLNPTIFLYNTETGLYYSQLTKVILPPTLKSIGAFAMAATRLESIDIPESVENIGVGAFHSCKHLEGEIKFPEGMTTLNNDCLYFCPYVESVRLPSTLEVIKVNALAGLIYLHEIKFPANLRQIEMSGCEAWYDFYGDLVIPAATESIGMWAFRSTKLNSLTFEAGSKIKVLPDEVFKGSLMNSLSLPENIEEIGKYAFYKCRVPEIIFPETLKSISEWAFSNNYCLQRIVLPLNIENIGNKAFAQCANLSEVYVKAMKVPFIDESTFDHPVNMTLYVPVGAKEAYAAADYWKDFGKIVEVEEFPSAGREAVIAGGGNAARAFGAQGAAVIEGEGARYAIFTTDGREVASGIADGRTEVPLPQGIYVARTGSTSHRIAVR